MSITIILASDDNFAVGGGVLMQSILENTKSAVRFVYFHSDLSSENLAQLEQVAATRVDCRLQLIDAQEALASLPSPLRSDVYSRMTYARLLAPELIDDDRAIYLDTDALVKDDIQRLYDWPLDGKPLAAIQDYGAEQLSIGCPVERDYYNEMTGGRGVGHYFNAGVLVMDLAEFRRRRLGEQALEIIRSGRPLRFADQCALNLVSQGEFAQLPARWNTLAVHRYLPFDKLIAPGLRRRVAEAFADPAVIHYIGQKPWTPFPTPLKHEFMSVLRRSPWRDYRYPLSSLTWKQRRALFRAWRNQAIGLRLRSNEINLRLLGRPILHWRRAAA
jgi:lipopolysaccharide biosynthesis glycosyltransferase